ncbi:glycosyltransferase family 2 protein [Nostoc sp. UHCC 0302]|uniref:glycosyltransferase family 2 protein n=1 Tax=Nostoc sp. UHCC 0302 TaxID=3134896 RepID=UPI00311CDC36
MELTVIIPIYNRARMLAQALESLRWQTYKDFVVIVCDDASTENLKEVVDKFTDLKIEYYHYENNVGQYRNFMRGLKLCQTTFIKYLDSDDLLFPEALEKQIKTLQEEPSAALCLGGILEFEEIPEQNQVNLFDYCEPYVPKLRTKRQWARLEDYRCFNPSACMYRTELLSGIGGFNTIVIGDWDIFVSLSSKYPVTAVNEPIFAYRFHADQITKTDNWASGNTVARDVLWLTSNANPYQERLGIPLSQQFFLRLEQCWSTLRTALSSNQKLFLLKKWLEIVISNKMLWPFIFAFPWFVTVKALRKPKVQTGASNNLNIEKYKNYICSILFNEKSISLSN